MTVWRRDERHGGRAAGLDFLLCVHHNSLPAVRPWPDSSTFSRDDREYAGRQGRQARARRHRPLRQDRSVQPARIGQGSYRTRRDRRRRTPGRAQLGQTVGRGDEQQYRHQCSHELLRAEGLSTRCHDGG